MHFKLVFLILRFHICILKLNTKFVSYTNILHLHIILASLTCMINTHMPLLSYANI